MKTMKPITQTVGAIKFYFFHIVLNYEIEKSTIPWATIVSGLVFDSSHTQNFGNAIPRKERVNLIISSP